MIQERRYLTAREKELLLVSQGRCCAICGHPFLATRKPQFDHVLPLSLNGTNEPDNWRAICAACHAPKSVREKKIAAKITRLSEVRPRWRKKLNGKVVVADGKAKMS